VLSFFLNRELSIPRLFFFPQSSTNLHRLFFGISLTPNTARSIFAHRLNRKRRRLYGSVQSLRFLNRCRDSERNREVCRLSDSAWRLQELNGDCEARLMREAQGCRVRSRGCDSLTAIAALAVSETSEAWRFGLESVRASRLSRYWIRSESSGALRFGAKVAIASPLL